jgi:lipopolysaccharide/colanic/teichoic acid biosynthesis glycosyltransferase
VTRAVDLVVGSVLLVVASPAIAACAIAVKLTSRGPAFYAAGRIGRDERAFRQYKLRSMRVGADAAGFRTATDDPRITPIGRFLRGTSLDELPQLWNVVRGDMGLVGPRPAAPAQLADYTADQRRIRASVRPGITGLAQVSGRSSLGLEQAVAFDLWYATHASVWTDLRILARTAATVLRRRGTN